MAEYVGISLTFECDVPYVVNADPTRLKQALLNLLSNAVKYNADRSSIIVSYEVLDGRLRIKVTDTGKGLTEQQQAKLFTPFEGLGTEFSNVSGTGIGLTITKQLVELMGGIMGIDSTKGKGSSFWLEPELSDASQISAMMDKVQQVKRPDPSGKRIIHVEDNLFNRELMQTIIRKMTGYHLLTASDRSLGLSLISEQLPDPILLDIQLSGMDGFEILKRLKEHPQAQRIPVIAVTANAIPNDVKISLEAGFNHYVAKPIQANILLEVIEQLIQDWNRSPNDRFKMIVLPQARLERRRGKSINDYASTRY